MCRVATKLASPDAIEIPPLPADLTAHLDAMHTASPKIISFPILRRFAPLAAAAAFALLISLAGTLIAQQEPGSLQPAPSAEGTPDPAPQFGISAGESGHTGGRRRAVIAATECTANNGERPPAAVKIRAEDARKFRSLLISQYGFKDADIVTLTNEDATSERIVSAINKQLIAKSQPGDVAVFMFSGHGTQVQDFDGDEDDGVDEAICPWDHDWSKVESWLTDDVIGNMAARLSQSNVLVVMDTCHSGTMTRGVGDDEIFGSMNVDSGFRPKPRSSTPKSLPPSSPGGPDSSTPAPYSLPPSNPAKPRNGEYLKPPEELLEQKMFPLPDRPSSGSPSFTQKDIDFMNEADSIIRDRNNDPENFRPKSPGSLDLEPLFEQKWFPLAEEQLREQLRKSASPESPTYLPKADAVREATEKLLKSNGVEPPFINEDWETLKAAEEFLRKQNSVLPESKLLLESIEKFGVMAKAVLNGHPIGAPHGAQVLLAATASDRLSWFS